MGEWEDFRYAYAVDPTAYAPRAERLAQEGGHSAEALAPDTA
ncbi:hypothetical protein AB8O64_05120 [Streptomyces sp. QH1-20]